MASGYIRYTASSLGEAEREFRYYHTTMKIFNVSSSLMPLVTPAWQLVLDLMGCTENDSVLVGEALDMNGLCNFHFPLSDAAKHVVYFELVCHFRKLDRANNLMEQLEKEEARDKTFCANGTHLCRSCLNGRSSSKKSESSRFLSEIP